MFIMTGREGQLTWSSSNPAPEQVSLTWAYGGRPTVDAGFVTSAFDRLNPSRLPDQPGVPVSHPLIISFLVPDERRKREIVSHRINEELTKIGQEHRISFGLDIRTDRNRWQVSTYTGPHMVALKKLREWSINGHVPVYNADQLPIWKGGLSGQEWELTKSQVTDLAGFGQRGDAPTEGGTLEPQVYLERDPSRTEIRVFTRNGDADETVTEALKTVLPGDEVVFDERAAPCSVCQDRGSPHVKMSCGHSYCRPCFFLLLSSQELPIRCVGNSDRCGTRWQSEEIKAKAYPALFERLMARSVRAFARTVPHLLLECPTGSCRNLLQATSPHPTPGLQFCKGCAFIICTNCRAPNHPGRTCFDFQSATQQGLIYVDETNSIAGIKSCPRCGTSVERAEGCYHILCTGCKQHFCFTCLQSFPDGPSVYEHMRVAHQDQQQHGP